MLKRRRSEEVACCNKRANKCPFQGEIKGQLEMLISSGKIFDYEDDSGNDALVHSAAGHDFCGPCIHTFNFLYYQEVRPYSNEQRADALDLLGSTCILMGNYEDGLNHWLDAASLRSSARTCFPDVNLPPLTRQHATPQWTTRDDVMRMRKRINTRRGMLDVLSQAQVVQHGHGVSLNVAKNQFLSNIMDDERLDIAERFARCKLALLMLEWDEFYGWHSLSFHREDSETQKEILHIIDYFNLQFKLLPSATEAGVRERLVLEVTVFFKWLATAFESYRGDSNNNGARSNYRRSSSSSFFFDSLLENTVTLLTEMCKSSIMSNQLEYCLERIVAADWRTSEGASLLFLACSSAYYNAFVDNYDPPTKQASAPSIEKLIRLLTRLGADVNSVDIYGNTCLHAIMKFELMTVNMTNVQFLLDKGACPYVPNESGKTLADKLRKCSREANSSANKLVLPLPKLQCLCAKALRMNNVKLDPKVLPDSIAKFVKMH